MARGRTPPDWQKGRHELELTLPARATASGSDETVGLVFRWEVRTAKPMSDRDWTKWEMRSARDRLAQAIRESARRKRCAWDLQSALTHAVAAWCRTHLRGRGISDSDYYRAFQAKAPDSLRLQAADAMSALHGLVRGETTSADAVATVTTTVEALLDAAAHPPRNRRRFPARNRSGRPPRKPRVKPGGWIDTGRFRPAEVLAVIAGPPHIVTLSYGDEIDNDFRPHIVEWKSVRKRAYPPSLKDVFAPGDRIRHTHFGCGRVLAVRNSTMDVAFDRREATLAPDPLLRNIKKLAGPELNGI